MCPHERVESLLQRRGVALLASASLPPVVSASFRAGLDGGFVFVGSHAGVFTDGSLGTNGFWPYYIHTSRMPPGFLLQITFPTDGNVTSTVVVVRRDPSARGSASMVIAWAGQIASHSLQAIQRSSPLG